MFKTETICVLFPFVRHSAVLPIRRNHIPDPLKHSIYFRTERERERERYVFIRCGREIHRFNLPYIVDCWYLIESTSLQLDDNCKVFTNRLLPFVMLLPGFPLLSLIWLCVIKFRTSDHIAHAEKPSHQT